MNRAVVRVGTGVVEHERVVVAGIQGTGVEDGGVRGGRVRRLAVVHPADRPALRDRHVRRVEEEVADRDAHRAGGADVGLRHVVHPQAACERRLAARELRVLAVVRGLDAAGLLRAVVGGRSVDGRDRVRALREDDLEVRRAGTLEVGRPPLDHELAVGLATGDGSEDARPSGRRVEVVLVRDERTVEAVDRQRGAAGRLTAVRRQELKVSVRADERARVGGAVDRDRERDVDLRRTVVTVVAGVGGAGNDRLTRLRVRRVDDSRTGRGQAGRGQSDDREHGRLDGQADETSAHALHSLPLLGLPRFASEPGCRKV